MEERRANKTRNGHIKCKREGEREGGREGCGWAWRASEFMPDDEKPKVSDMASQAYILSEIYINLQRSSQIQADIPKN